MFIFNGYSTDNVPRYGKSRRKRRNLSRVSSELNSKLPERQFFLDSKDSAWLLAWIPILLPPRDNRWTNAFHDCADISSVARVTERGNRWSRPTRRLSRGQGDRFSEERGRRQRRASLNPETTVYLRGWELPDACLLAEDFRWKPEHRREVSIPDDLFPPRFWIGETLDFNFGW